MSTRSEKLSVPPHVSEKCKDIQRNAISIRAGIQDALAYMKKEIPNVVWEKWNDLPAIIIPKEISAKMHTIEKKYRNQRAATPFIEQLLQKELPSYFH